VDNDDDDDDDNDGQGKVTIVEVALHYDVNEYDGHDGYSGLDDDCNDDEGDNNVNLPFSRLRFAFVVVIGATMLTLFLR